MHKKTKNQTKLWLSTNEMRKPNLLHYPPTSNPLFRAYWCVPDMEKKKKQQQKQNTLHLPRTTTEQQVLRSYQFPWQHVRYTTSNISKTVTNLGAVISPYLGDGTGLETGKEDGKLRRGGGRTLYRKITNTYPNLSAGSKFFTSRHPFK